jgi:hypothetical protein
VFNNLVLFNGKGHCPNSNGCGYVGLSQLVRAIDFTTVLNWLVVTRSLVFFTKVLSGYLTSIGYKWLTFLTHIALCIWWFFIIN